MATYNGWKNRQTWNVALWVNNEEPLYRAARAWMEAHKGVRGPYKRFCAEYGLTGERTPDGISFTGTRLDYNALNEMMRDLI